MLRSSLRYSWSGDLRTPSPQKSLRRTFSAPLSKKELNTFHPNTNISTSIYHAMQHTCATFAQKNTADPRQVNAVVLYDEKQSALTQTKELVEGEKIAQHLIAQGKKLIKEVVENQQKHGYSVDDWELTTLEQIANEEGIVSLVASLVDGELSLYPMDGNITLENFIKGENAIINSKEPGSNVPVGTSRFFSPFCAFMQGNNVLHAKVHRDGTVHYHHLSQVSPGLEEDKETGEVKQIYGLRETMGAFVINLNKYPYLKKVPMAVSKAENNTYRFVGSNKVYLGEGGAAQYYAPPGLVPFIHRHVKFIKNQKEDNQLYSMAINKNGTTWIHKTPDGIGTRQDVLKKTQLTASILLPCSKVSHTFFSRSDQKYRHRAKLNSYGYIDYENIKETLRTKKP